MADLLCFSIDLLAQALFEQTWVRDVLIGSDCAVGVVWSSEVCGVYPVAQLAR